jgi:hypothetical protein
VRRESDLTGAKQDAQFQVNMGGSKDATTQSGKPRLEYHGK